MSIQKLFCKETCNLHYTEASENLQSKHLTYLILKINVFNEFY